MSNTQNSTESNMHKPPDNSPEFSSPDSSPNSPSSPFWSKLIHGRHETKPSSESKQSNHKQQPSPSNKNLISSSPSSLNRRDSSSNGTSPIELPLGPHSTSPTTSRLLGLLSNNMVDQSPTSPVQVNMASKEDSDLETFNLTSPNKSPKEKDKKKQTFSFMSRSKPHVNSLPIADANIVQTTQDSSAYSSLFAVAEKDKASKLEKDKTSKLEKEVKSKDSKPAASLTDKLFEALLAAALPAVSLDMSSTEQRALHMKSHTPFSISVMGQNFCNMTARTGVIYDAYYSVLRIVTWETPAHTLSVLVIYSFLVLNPRLIPTIPFLFLLTYLMVPAYFSRHPSDPTLLVPDPLSDNPIDKKLSNVVAPPAYQPPPPNPFEKQDIAIESKSSAKPYPSSLDSYPLPSPNTSSTVTFNASASDVLIHHNLSPLISKGPPLGEPVVPKPVPEMSREFYMNMVDTQNAMDLYVQAYDTILSLLSGFAFFHGDETTSSFVYIILISSVFVSYYLTPILISIIPWKALFLIGGWVGVIQFHPQYSQAIVSEFIKNTSSKVNQHLGNTCLQKTCQQKSEISPGFSDSHEVNPQTEKSKPEHDKVQNDNTNNAETMTTKGNYIDQFTSTLSTSFDLKILSNLSFWDTVSETAHIEFDFHDSLQQKLVEVFEFQFARTEVPEWAPRSPGNEDELVWDHWDQEKRVDNNLLMKSNGYDGKHAGIFPNWEPSLYTNTSLIPRVRLSVTYSTQAQVDQLESVLETLQDPNQDNDDESESDDDKPKDKEETLKFAKKAQRAAKRAGSSNPFVLPGFVSLNQFQAPPFWQFVPGTSWKKDMDVLKWVERQGMEFGKEPVDNNIFKFYNMYGDDDQDFIDGYLLSEDGKFLVDTNEKWVYNTEPITYQSEMEPAEEIKREVKKEISSLNNPETTDETKEGQDGNADNTASSSTSSQNIKAASDEKHVNNDVPTTKKRLKKIKGDVMWVRRRRWTRVCVRHPISREVVK